MYNTIHCLPYPDRTFEPQPPIGVSPFPAINTLLQSPRTSSRAACSLGILKSLRPSTRRWVGKVGSCQLTIKNATELPRYPTTWKICTSTFHAVDDRPMAELVPLGSSLYQSRLISILRPTKVPCKEGTGTSVQRKKG